MNTPSAPDAKLLIAPGCAHCPAVLQHLSTLLKENLIGKLEVINIHQHPEIAQQLNVRSVPWLQLGEFTLNGAYSLSELRDYASFTGSESGISQYIEKQLAEGQLSALIEEIKHHPHWLKSVLQLLMDDDTSMQVRLGLDSLIESLAGSEILFDLANELGQLSKEVHISRLADIIHYLGLTHNPGARAFIETHCNNENPDIREVCQDALEEINTHVQ
jgi:thioredoxin-like negative regulator of GroEL